MEMKRYYVGKEEAIRFKKRLNESTSGTTLPYDLTMTEEEVLKKNGKEYIGEYSIGGNKFCVVQNKESELEVMFFKSATRASLSQARSELVKLIGVKLKIMKD
jgi:hypothetical protein